jgi:hypothetical protein
VEGICSSIIIRWNLVRKLPWIHVRIYLQWDMFKWTLRDCFIHPTCLPIQQTALIL